MNKFTSWGLSFLAGAALTLSFGPLNWACCALLAPAVLFALWNKGSNQASSGFAYGLGLYGFGVSWVFVSIHTFGQSSILVASCITGLFVVLLASTFALQGTLYVKLKTSTNLSNAYLVFPSLYVLFECLKEWFCTGFPWALVGLGHLDSPIKYFAPIGSVYLVSWVSLGFSVSLVLLLIGKASERRLAILVLLILSITTQLLPRNWTKPGEQQGVSLIQGNVSPMDKFSASHPMQAIRQNYGLLTEANWNDLVLWPEAAIGLTQTEAVPLLDYLQTAALTNKSNLLTGLIIRQGDLYYNGLVGLGQAQGQYLKHHLLPFGDYLPGEQYLRGLLNFFDLPMSEFSAGQKLQAPIHTPNYQIASFICYEIAFANLVRASLREAAVIVNISEDGWFGNSIGPHQHLDQARMRALETGRYVLRATPTGISAIIDSSGKVVKRSPQNKQVALKGHFHLMDGQTPWSRYGFYPWGLLILGLLIWTWVRR